MSDTSLPVVTLHQPWASLVLAGVKRFETRSWAPPIRLIGNRLGVHAGLFVNKKLPADLAAAVVDILGRDWADTVPTGCLLCTATVRGAWKTGLPMDLGMIATETSREGSPSLSCFKSDLFGDYAPGRWIWGLEAIEKQIPPRPARGKQGVWLLPSEAFSA